MKFKGKKVIVTGAYRSIGREIARQFALEGAEVVISYRNNASAAEEFVKEMAKLGMAVKALPADFSHEKGVKGFYEESVSYLKYVDILVNNAGNFFPERLLDLSAENLQSSFQINTIAPFLLIQLCAKNMIENNIKGNIINISSIAASLTLPRGIAYALSKSALNKLTQNAALDLAEYGIRVNAIAPGPVADGMNKEKIKNQREQWEKRIEQIPLKRPGTPKDIAHMALFLSLEESSWMTGKIFEVDGGAVL